MGDMPAKQNVLTVFGLAYSDAGAALHVITYTVIKSLQSHSSRDVATKSSFYLHAYTKSRNKTIENQITKTRASSSFDP